MKIDAIAVFCGSKNGKNPNFASHTQVLGELIAKENVTLVYGGGNAGLMGIVADAALANGGQVIGVIPQALVNIERQHDGLTQLHITTDMHERKKKLYDLCDAAVILPGGYGTLDELFEIITWNQLSLHDKKIFVLNTDGYYNALFEHIRKMNEEHFILPESIDAIIILEKPEQILTFL